MEEAFAPGDKVTWRTGDHITDKVRASFAQEPPYEVLEYVPPTLESFESVMSRHAMGMDGTSPLPVSAKVVIKIDGKREQFGAGHFVQWES
jgi:hypothetical protein